MILRARMVLPMAQPPLEDGAVRIQDGTIARVGRWREMEPAPGERVLDLGDSIILPGLINAHCHLQYTHLAGCLPPGASFSGWLKAMVRARDARGPADPPEQSRIEGAAILLDGGVTTAANIESSASCASGLLQATPLRIISQIEMTGVLSGASPETIVERALSDIERFLGPSGGDSERAGLSPHSLYATRPELVRLAARSCRARGWKLAMHVAESREEFEMFQHRAGPLFDWLKEHRDMDDCGGVSPVQQLARLDALDEGLLAVHVNYLASGDAALLGTRGASVVHCPRSHAFFGHDPFPLRELRAAGVNLALGTDSAASVPPSDGDSRCLDMFAEMRALAAAAPELPPRDIVEMATLNAARALGLESRAGALRAGAPADLLALPWKPEPEVWETVVHSTGEARVMIGGEWVGRGGWD